MPSLPRLSVIGFEHPDLAPAAATARHLLAAVAPALAACGCDEPIDRLAVALQCVLWADDSADSPETCLNALERATAWMLSGEPDPLNRLVMMATFWNRVLARAAEGADANAAARAPAAGSA